MFCSECGTENSDESKYCVKCGVDLIKQEQEVTPSISSDKVDDTAKDEKMSAGNVIAMVVAALFLVKCSLSDKEAANESSTNQSNANHVSRDISVTQTQADALIQLIRASGYSCGSLSSALQSSYDGSFSVTCNNWKYRYDVEDIGGNWRVTVD